MNKKILILVTMIMLLSIASLGCVEQPAEPPVPPTPPVPPVEQPVVPPTPPVPPVEQPVVPPTPPVPPVEQPVVPEKQPEIEILRLATTTSLYDTGLLDYLEPIFEKRYNVDLQIISAGTGRAIRHGRDGDVDVLLVHARPAEDAFVRDGFGVNRRCIAYNFFLIVGPKSDPAGIRGMAPDDAFIKLMEEGMRDPRGVKFVSRGDNSGTHIKEIEIWRAAGRDYEVVRRSGRWYIEAGAGMGATLRMANEKFAYTLVDIGTFLAFIGRGELDPVPLVEEGKELFNPYGVIAINSTRHPKANFDMANNFINFLMAEDVQRMIGEFGYEAHGRPLFYPLARDCKEWGCPTWELCKTLAS